MPCTRQRAVEPASTFRHVSAAGPIRRQVRAESKREIVLSVVREAPLERRAKVGVLALEFVQGGALFSAGQPWCGSLGKLGVVPRMPAAQRLQLAMFRCALARKLADRLEHRHAWLTWTPPAWPHEAFGRQGLDRFQCRGGGRRPATVDEVGCAGGGLGAL